MALGDLVIGATVTGRRWWSLIFGLLVVVAASSLPIVGGWVAFLVMLFGVGAILLAPFSRTTHESPEPVGTP
jgi:hypothetical protein